MKLRRQVSRLFFISSIFFACEKETTEEVKNLPLLLEAEKEEQFLGGVTSINLATERAFTEPSVNIMTFIQELDHGVGEALFDQSWTSTPSSTKARDGLGPFFNARACASCHVRDGRGKAPENTTSAEFKSGLLLRISIPGTSLNGAPVPVPLYGGQLQDNSIQTIEKEGNFTIFYNEIMGEYSDGSQYSLRKPTYTLTDLKHGERSDILTSPRVAPHIIGMGLIDALTDQSISENADPNDADNDGISGKVNMVWDEVNKKKAIGKFGWKANTATITEQVAAALVFDMGITNPIFPSETCLTEECDTLPNGGIPEIPQDNFDKMVFYSSTLAVPKRRNWEDQDVLMGKNLFINLGCSKCHTMKMVTGSSKILSGLSNQTIRPYSDFLLHDMGEGLSDNRQDFEAAGYEWKTPPLWGIGLFGVVNRHTHYLHDGRARNLEEAILWHDGEASNSTDGFKELNKKDRERLLLFLNSL